MISLVTLYLVLWLVVIGIYFQIADRFNIVDKPNQRSSHTRITIRGGGILFPLAALVAWPYTNASAVLLAAALLLLSLVSFVDDIRSLPSVLRLSLQLLAMLAVCYYYSSSVPLYVLPVLLLLLVGITNAYNFMDGINGITVLYSLVGMGTLYWVQHNIVALMPERFFLSVLAAIGVFGFFNFRRKAKTFAGDVGSVSMAMILCLLLLDLVIQTQNLIWILLLAVYGMDTVATIVCRLFRREAILQAHRSHFYQYLANEAGWSHLVVSALYGISQLILNIAVLYGYLNGQLWVPLAFLFVFLTIYIIFRLRLEGPRRLFVQY
jgi:UDP-N-acetylmuramyl pentapeptide phosphotransferase/UDP-N-acetylglucosamine-1-phosphate transferase